MVELSPRANEAAAMRYTILLLVPAVMTGCASMTPTEQGVLGGGALGGVTGAIVGNAVGNTGAGAAIGAGVGALAGGLTGNAVEKSEQRAVQQAAAIQQQRQLALTDIVQMTQGGLSDPVIVGQIRATGSVYNLSPAELQWLKDSGVHDAVILEMQQTASRPGPMVYRRGPRPVYFVEQPVIVGPPPPVVGVGFSYGHCRHW